MTSSLSLEFSDSRCIAIKSLSDETAYAIIIKDTEFNLFKIDLNNDKHYKKKSKNYPDSWAQESLYAKFTPISLGSVEEFYFSSTIPLSSYGNYVGFVLTSISSRQASLTGFFTDNWSVE